MENKFYVPDEVAPTVIWNRTDLTLKVRRGNVWVCHLGIKAKKNEEGNSGHTFDETLLVELFNSSTNFIASACVILEESRGKKS